MSVFNSTRKYEKLAVVVPFPQDLNIGTQGVQELFFCEVKASGDRSIQGSVYSNNLVNLTSFFGYDVQEERKREIMMYIRSYRTASNLNSLISSKTYPKNYKQ